MVLSAALQCSHFLQFVRDSPIDEIGYDTYQVPVINELLFSIFLPIEYYFPNFFVSLQQVSANRRKRRKLRLELWVQSVGMTFEG